MNLIYLKFIQKKLQNQIKLIIHKTTDSLNKTLCVFGVLENNNKKIEEEMLKWLIPNYNI